MTGACVDARFWFAPGVEVFTGVLVPNPPPRSYCFMIAEPVHVWAMVNEFTPENCRAPQSAEFVLSTFGRGSEVAHYDLASRPPRGWRWTAVDGKIAAERVR